MGQISTYQDLVDAIEQDGVEQTVRANRKPPLHTRILRELYELYPDRPEYVAFLAEYPLIPSDLAETIASTIPEDYVDIARGLAANPRSSQITLNRLCEHADPRVRLALAANPNLTPKECQTLVEDENEFVRATLATNPSLPTPLQFILSADEQTSVRLALVGRKNLDADIAVHLSRDPDSSVCAAVIQTWSQDPEILHYWAETGDARIQQALLKRTKELEPALLDTLALSSFGNVRRTAVQLAGMKEAHLLSLAESDSPLDRIFLAEYTRIPSALQRILAQDTSVKVRRRLAANANLDEGIALHIAASDDLSSCKALAQNPSISAECVSQLCTHSEDQVALLVSYREDLNAEHLDLLLNAREISTVAEHLAYREIGYDSQGRDCADALAHSAAPSIRNFAAKGRELSPEILSGLSSDAYQPTRLAVAKHASTPSAALKELTYDDDRDIVFAAEDTLTKQDVSWLNTRTASDDAEDSRAPIVRKYTHLFED